MEETDLIPDFAQPEPDRGPDTVPDNGVFKKLADHCKTLYDLFGQSSYRTKKMEEITESHMAYNELAEDEDFPWEGAYNHVLPFVSITADNIEPRLVAALTGRDPIVTFEMTGLDKKDLIAEVLENWFNETLKNKIGIKSLAINICHTLLLEGTWYAIPEYEKQENVRRDFQFDQDGELMTGPDGIPIKQDIVDPKEERVIIQQYQFQDVFVADNIGTIDEWEKADKIVIKRPAFGELWQRRNTEGYLNIGPWLIPHKTKTTLTEDEASPSQTVEGIEVTGKEVIKTADFYISYPIYWDVDKEEVEQATYKEEKIVVTIAMDTWTVIRIMKLIDLNWRNESLLKRVRLYPESGKSYGTGVYGKMKSIQNGATDFFNLMLNSCLLGMMQYYFYEEGAGVKGVQKVKPGQGIKADNIDRIKFPQFNPIAQAEMPVMSLFLQLWERRGNISNPQMGRPSDEKKTATEIMTVVQEGNLQFNYQSEQIKYDEFISLLQLIYDLYYQNAPLNLTTKYQGQNVPIKRIDMKRNYKFMLTASTETANKMIERRESEDIMKMTAGHPLVNPMAPLEDVLRAYGRTDVEKYINPQMKQMIDAVLANPELMAPNGPVAQYLQAKAMMTKGQQGGKPVQ